MCPSTVKNSLLAGERAGLGGWQHQGKNLATIAKNAELSILSLLFGDFLSGQYLERERGGMWFPGPEGQAGGSNLNLSAKCQMPKTYGKCLMQTMKYRI